MNEVGTRDRERLVLDASAINALEADKSLCAVARSLGGAFEFVVPATAFSEVFACPDQALRRRLFEAIRLVLDSGICLRSFSWIVQEHVKAYWRDPSSYDWRRHGVRFWELEEEIYRDELIHSVSAETRAMHKKLEALFRDVHRDVKAAFPTPARSREPSPSLREVTKALLAVKGPCLVVGAGLIESVVGRNPSGAETRAFMERSPPFKAMLLAEAVAFYDRCLRPERERSPGRAGRIDMLSAVYLPYCSAFVTNDNGQWRALKEVSALAHLSASVLRYSEFRSRALALRL